LRVHAPAPHPIRPVSAPPFQGYRGGQRWALSDPEGGSASHRRASYRRELEGRRPRAVSSAGPPRFARRPGLGREVSERGFHPRHPRTTSGLRPASSEGCALLPLPRRAFGSPWPPRAAGAGSYLLRNRSLRFPSSARPQALPLRPLSIGALGERGSQRLPQGTRPFRG
jgi:hypothetical protein